jgi:hypothetical protein
MTALTKIKFSNFHARMIAFINTLNIAIDIEEIDQCTSVLRELEEAGSQSEPEEAEPTYPNT